MIFHTPELVLQAIISGCILYRSWFWGAEPLGFRIEVMYEPDDLLDHCL